MGCNDLDPSATCAPTPPNINIGSAFTIDFFLRDKAQTPWEAIDITGSTEIEVILLNADNTFLGLKLSLTQVSIIDAKDGHFQAKATAVQSALLKPSASPLYSDIEVHVTTGAGDLLIALLPQSVNLIPRLFPTAP